jgi:hypothetical protein
MGKPQRQRAVLVGVGQRQQRHLRDADNGGQYHNAQHNRAGQYAKPRPAQIVADKRHDKQQPQKAVHHGRYAGQQLDSRAEDVSHRHGRKLRQKDTAAYADGYANQHRAQGHKHQAHNHGENPVQALTGRPFHAKYKIEQPYLGYHGDTLHKDKQGD